MIPKLRNMTSLYLTCGEKILLLYRKGSRVANDVWVGSAGGHFEKDELNSPEDCVLRELNEELSLTPDILEDLQLKYVTLRRIQGEIRQNYYFFAELPDGLSMNLASNEGILKWYDLDELDGVAMPYTSRHVIDHYLAVGRTKSQIFIGVADGEKIVFTKAPEFL